MSTDAVIISLMGMVVALVGIVYALIRAEQIRHGKNIHKLRNKMQAIVLMLATKGIIVPRSEDDIES